MTSQKDHTIICLAAGRKILVLQGMLFLNRCYYFTLKWRHKGGAGAPKAPLLETSLNPWHTFCCEGIVCGLCVFGYGSATRKGRKLRITRRTGVGSFFGIVVC